MVTLNCDVLHGAAAEGVGGNFPGLCFSLRFILQKWSQKFMGMKCEALENEICGLFGGNVFRLFFPGKIVLSFVTKTSPHSSHLSSQSTKKFVT